MKVPEAMQIMEFPNKTNAKKYDQNEDDDLKFFRRPRKYSNAKANDDKFQSTIKRKMTSK